MNYLKKIQQHIFLSKWNENSNLVKREKLLINYLNKHYPLNNLELKDSFKKEELNVFLIKLLTEYFNPNNKTNHISVSLYKVFLLWNKELFYFWKELGFEKGSEEQDIIKFLINSGNNGWLALKKGFKNSTDMSLYSEYVINCIFTRPHVKFETNYSCVKQFCDSYQIDKGFYVMNMLIEMKLAEPLTRYILEEQQSLLDKEQEKLKQHEQIMLAVVLS
jgi:hypothetical protein